MVYGLVTYTKEHTQKLSGIAKSVRGGAWNSNISKSWERSYKPYLFSARSIGIRLVKPFYPIKPKETKDYLLLVELFNDQKLLQNNIFQNNRIITNLFKS